VAETARILRDDGVPEAVAWCDRNRMEQVLINLINNSLDAMRGQPAPAWLACAVADGRAQVTCATGPRWARRRPPVRALFTTKPAGGAGPGLACRPASCARRRR
jgi:two-component system C4-dicarboxylate transport sensor histidine kinase DctB